MIPDFIHKYGISLLINVIKCIDKQFFRSFPLLYFVNNIGFFFFFLRVNLDFNLNLFLILEQ